MGRDRDRAQGRLQREKCKEKEAILAAVIGKLPHLSDLTYKSLLPSQS